MKGTFTIFTGTNGQYYFNLKASNGQKILASEGYVYRTSCVDGIQSVRNNAPIELRYSRKIASNGQYYFTLHGANGEVIGTSENYVSPQGRDGGIEDVKRYAPYADLV